MRNYEFGISKKRLKKPVQLKISNIESYASFDELASYCKDFFALSKDFDESSYGFKALPQMILLSDIEEILKNQ